MAKASGPSLIEAIIARGGVIDQTGELAAMNVQKKLVRGGAALGQGDIIGGGDNQYGADDVVRQMWEEDISPTSRTGRRRTIFSTPFAKSRLAMYGARRTMMGRLIRASSKPTVW